jgi:hypothetical protein
MILVILFFSTYIIIRAMERFGTNMKYTSWGLISNWNLSFFSSEFCFFLHAYFPHVYIYLYILRQCPCWRLCKLLGSSFGAFQNWIIILQGWVCLMSQWNWWSYIAIIEGLIMFAYMVLRLQLFYTIDYQCNFSFSIFVMLIDYGFV